MNCIGCGDLVDRDGRNDHVCRGCREALARCKREGIRPAFVIAEHFRRVRLGQDDDTVVFPSLDLP